MQFRVGQIIAKCPGCGGMQFKIPENEHSGPRMSYVCADCGKASEYSKLVTQIGRAVAKPVRQVLRGTRPQDIPVEIYDRVELAVKLRVAKELGITIPDPVILRADQVVR